MEGLQPGQRVELEPIRGTEAGQSPSGERDLGAEPWPMVRGQGRSPPETESFLACR